MGDRVVELAIVGVGGYAAYELLYKPWAVRQELQRIADAAALAALQKGGTKKVIEDAIAGACTAGAAVYKVPPGLAAPLCQGVGLVAVEGAKLAAKGAVIAGKAIGSGAAVVGKGIGKGVKAAVYTAPKAGVRAVGKGVKSVAKAVSHGFGLWGLGDYAALEAPPLANPFAAHGAGKRGAAGQRRSLAAPAGAGRRRLSSGAEYYTRHL